MNYDDDANMTADVTDVTTMKVIDGWWWWRWLMYGDCNGDDDDEGECDIDWSKVMLMVIYYCRLHWLIDYDEHTIAATWRGGGRSSSSSLL